MIFCAYLALFLSSKLLQGDCSNDILIQTLMLSAGTNAMVQTICYINFLSYDVSRNLKILKESVSENGSKESMSDIDRGNQGMKYIFLGVILSSKIRWLSKYAYC